MSLRDQFDPTSEYDLGSPRSVSEEPPPAQRKTAKRARKPRTDQCKAWKVKGVVNVDVFAGESTDGMTVEAKTNMLKEWLRVGNEKPPVVLSMTVLVNSADYPLGACRIHLTGYVQTKKTSVNPLKAWIISDDCVWTQMKGGLCGNPEFEDDMKKTVPWVILPIFSKVALNNAGRKAKRVIARLHPCVIFEHEMLLIDNKYDNK